ncbi:MAG: hypothetical protein EBU90_21525 [Proteobacteria bacterium]|nr:hypothetical protein [Pseudomonadota bacterium]NBP15617.1 hypothetical protein [bacterium]
MKIKLGIKDKHITFGEIANPQNCAIAKALKEKVHNVSKIGVFPGNVYLVVKKNKKNIAYKGKLSQKAVNFIKAFDAGKPVNQFILSLNLKPIANNFAKEIA